MIEVLSEQFMYYDPPLSLESMSSSELYEAAIWYKDPFLLNLSDERKVSEGADMFLKNLTEGEEIDNGEDI